EIGEGGVEAVGAFSADIVAAALARLGADLPRPVLAAVKNMEGREIAIGQPAIDMRLGSLRTLGAAQRQMLVISLIGRGAAAAESGGVFEILSVIAGVI